MKIVRAPLQSKNNAIAQLLLALVSLFLLSVSAAAQSTDAEYPTLIRSNEISGTIAPRDVGDPRLTRYFYSFTGTPGDLIVTVESRNLEGDVDVFTTGTLRPLGKVSMYAGVSTSGGTKTPDALASDTLRLAEAYVAAGDRATARARLERAADAV